MPVSSGVKYNRSISSVFVSLRGEKAKHATFSSTSLHFIAGFEGKQQVMTAIVVISWWDLMEMEGANLWGFGGALVGDVAAASCRGKQSCLAGHRVWLSLVWFCWPQVGCCWLFDWWVGNSCAQDQWFIQAIKRKADQDVCVCVC